MAATFRPVNNPVSPGPQREDIMTTSPTTPRSCAPPASHPIAPPSTMDDATTPTRATFSSSALAAQKPLPTSPFPDAVQIPETADNLPKRENSQHSRKSRDSDEMDMDESDGETGAGDDGGSDDESVNADGTKSNKKKKSQRFYCTDYPPCNLSFTRSEHLARHIRKHTGERPFQCHCSRRFSRLDNLRQHAQTVHVNEDIPIDSLAATGTRFQRQIRTDRVRTTSGRARASTAGSLGAPVRGHSKSLSTSSIASISSVGSAYSGREDVRRRPPPLVMAADPRARHSLESYRSTADSQFSFRPISPSDFSTPTSATFSTGQSSPRWGSGVASPISSHSRSQSMYATGSRTPGRRLSVPSSGNPLQSPHSMNLGRHLFAPGSVNSPNSAVFSPSNNSSLLSSPTAGASGWSRRESMSTNADEAWRRRTWHPDTREYSTGSSRLSSVVTPSQFQSPAAPLPIAAPSQQSNVRLPGIESFGPLPRRPGSPLRSIPSPMAIDSEVSIPIPAPHETEPSAEERRGVPQWDMGLHRGLTRLEIASSTPPRDSASSWANEANQVIQAQAEQARVNPPTVRFETETQVVQLPPSLNPSAAMSRGHQHTMSAPVINDTPREMKRRGWYHGPVTVTSASGEPTAADRGSRVDRMVHPNLAHGFSGFPARVPQTVHEQQQQHDQQQQPPQLGPDHTANRDTLRGLDALVAVATSEGNIATAC